MAEELKDIDTSPIDQLTAIKVEQDQLDEFQRRAELMKDKVDALVYRRVLDDYQKRRTALELQATPLKSKARTEYQKLKLLHQRVKTAFEEARLAKEELEFRNAVGELSDGDLASQVQEPQGRLDQRQSDLNEIDACKARFLSVVSSEKELEAEPPKPEPPKVEPPKPPAPAPEPARAVSPDSGKVTAATPVAADLGVFTRPPLPPLPSDDSDVSTNPRLSAQDLPIPSSDGSMPDMTFVVPDARLMPVDDSTDGAEFRLGVVTTIGRSGENHIRLVKPGVSRRHASISLTPRGFAIEDLESQNGTFINGERVPKHTLVDGDLIWIGDVKMMFRTAWSPAGASTPAAAARADERPEPDGGDQNKQARKGRRS
ncbi:MAG: FHA domain-containing protein [Vicinamibacterales bacterium]